MLTTSWNQIWFQKTAVVAELAIHREQVCSRLLVWKIGLSVRSKKP